MNFYISPPFGNYLTYFPGTIPIRGSFTLYPRPGLLSRLHTIYYSNKDQGWVNKIGLRNKGIDYAIDKIKSVFFEWYYKNNIISVAILEHSDIKQLLEKIPDDTKLEINISCPNTDHDMIKHDVHLFLNPKRQHCSLKCSPLITTQEIDNFYKLGFRTFHFSNTIPHQMGELSGTSIIPYTSKLIKYTRDKYEDDVEIIAGDGIRNIDQVLEYKKLGCNHISVSSLCFNPLLFIMFYGKFMYYKHFTNRLD